MKKMKYFKHFPQWDISYNEEVISEKDVKNWVKGSSFSKLKKESDFVDALCQSTFKDYDVLVFPAHQLVLFKKWNSSEEKHLFDIVKASVEDFKKYVYMDKVNYHVEHGSIISIYYDLEMYPYLSRIEKNSVQMVKDVENIVNTIKEMKKEGCEGTPTVKHCYLPYPASYYVITFDENKESSSSRCVIASEIEMEFIGGCISDVVLLDMHYYREMFQEILGYISNKLESENIVFQYGDIYQKYVKKIAKNLARIEKDENPFHVFVNYEAFLEDTKNLCDVNIEEYNGEFYDFVSNFGIVSYMNRSVCAMVNRKNCHRLSNSIYSAPGIFFIEGCSGSGKDRNYLIPNVLCFDHDYVFVEADENLRNEIGHILKEKGYEILVISKQNGQSMEQQFDLLETYVNLLNKQSKIAVFVELEDKDNEYYEVFLKSLLAKRYSYVKENAVSRHLHTYFNDVESLFTLGQFYYVIMACHSDNASFSVMATKRENVKKSFDVPEFYDEFYRNLDAEIILGPVASYHSYVSSRGGGRTVAETFWKISPEQCSVRKKGKDFLLDKKMDCPKI